MVYLYSIFFFAGFENFQNSVSVDANRRLSYILTDGLGEATVDEAITFAWCVLFFQDCDSLNNKALSVLNNSALLPCYGRYMWQSFPTHQSFKFRGTSHRKRTYNYVNYLWYKGDELCACSTTRAAIEPSVQFVVIVDTLRLLSKWPWLMFRRSIIVSCFHWTVFTWVARAVTRCSQTELRELVDAILTKKTTKDVALR